MECAWRAGLGTIKGGRKYMLKVWIQKKYEEWRKNNVRK